MPWHESIIEAELAKAKVLVNATSIGLTADESPIPAEILMPDLLVLDLIYAQHAAAARRRVGGLRHVRRRADAAPPGRGLVHAVDRPAGAARRDAGRRSTMRAPTACAPPRASRRRRPDLRRGRGGRRVAGSAGD